MTEKQPETRTRVLYDTTAKDGWRCKEICIELTGHDNPVKETSALFHRLRGQAERDTNIANLEHQPSLKGTRS